MKKIGFYLLTALTIAVIAMAGCENSNNGNNDEKIIPLEGIEFNTRNITIVLGGKSTLTITKNPENATDKLAWESDDPDTVSIDQTGKITGLKLTGEDNEVEIIIKSDDNPEISARCYIKVINEEDYVSVTGLTLTPLTLNLKMREIITGQLAAAVQPDNATDQSINWTTSNAAVATVSDGLVTAIKDGTAVIAASSNDGGFTKTCVVTVEPAGQIYVKDGIDIIESGGWLETLFVKWDKMGAASYNVYYRGNSIDNWKQIDNPLIREYGGYYRADILGLKAGLYDVEVRAVNDDGVEYGYYGSVTNIQAEAHVRSGFAFVDAVPGAYNMNGTLKSGAQVLYLSAQNAKTVTLSVKESASKTSTFTGIGKILSIRQKGYDITPLAIRIIGRINAADIDELGSNNLLQIKGSGTNTIAKNITLEGVGNDAVAYGWGILVRNAHNIEIRNIGLIMFPEDAVSLDTGPKNVWIHNNDFFYGQNKGGDKEKGDGAMDVKISDLVTISFNHFWDSGKASLLGNDEKEAEGRITYHHNWFDHSDSRHPRVRVHTAHVYNNLYDGIAKYGIGATCNSLIFIERNFFSNSRRPMLISLQGSDIAGGSKGEFSSEIGGMIKAFDNYMDDNSKAEYRPYSASNTIEFDAYVVNSRNETVPASVKAKQGGTVYNNFDTASGFYLYNSESPQDAKQTVEKWAGRYWKGDIAYTFAAGDNTNHARMSALDTILQSYTSKLVSIQSGGNNNPGPGTDPDPEPDPDTELPSGAITCSFGMSGSTGSSVFVTNNLFKLTSANGTKPSNSATINGVTYNVALKLESSTKIDFTVTSPMTLKLYTDAPNGNVGVNGTNRTLDSQGVLTFELAAGTHQITRGSSGKNLWLIVLEPK